MFLTRRFARSVQLLAATVAIASAACGGRSELATGDASAEGGAGGSEGGAPPAQACVTDAECGTSDACVTHRCVGGTCVALGLTCDDGQACTDDRCDPLIGCVFSSRTLDADGDGFNAPLPGFLPGADGACGNDCNDHDAQVSPTGKEACDGLDNDCNGIVDDGMSYVPSRLGPVRVSTLKDKRASRGGGGFVATPDGFMLNYDATVTLPQTGGERSQSLLKGLDSSGSELFETPVSDVNADTFAGALAWSGDVLSSAWSDARTGNEYEVYFGRFNAQGQKLAPDLRVTNAPGKSLYPDLVVNQSELVLAWDDRRGQRPGGADAVKIFGQRVALDGSLQGMNLLIADDPVSEKPALAAGAGRVGLVYTTTTDTSRFGFRLLDVSLSPVGARVAPMGSDVQSPSVHFVGDRFVVLWEIYPTTGLPGDAIWGAVFDAQGKLVVDARPITSGGHFARFHSALSLGDRLLTTWTDDHDGNLEIYWEILASDLSVLQPRQRLTFDSSDSYGATVALGPDGTVGVVYNDSPDGTLQVYFTTLACAPSFKIK